MKMQMKDAVVNIGVRQEEIQKYLFELDEKLCNILETLDSADRETAYDVIKVVYEQLDELYQKL